MFPSLSANTIGISKILVFDKSGVVGDLIVFIGDEDVEGTESPVEVRTMVNLVGLKDCCWDIIGDCIVVCFAKGLGVDKIVCFGITDTTGFGDDLSVTNFCVDPEGFSWIN